MEGINLFLTLYVKRFSLHTLTSLASMCVYCFLCIWYSLSHTCTIACVLHVRSCMRRLSPSLPRLCRCLGGPRHSSDRDVLSLSRLLPRVISRNSWATETFVSAAVHLPRLKNRDSQATEMCFSRRRTSAAVEKPRQSSDRDFCLCRGTSAAVEQPRQSGPRQYVSK